MRGTLLSLLTAFALGSGCVSSKVENKPVTNLESNLIKQIAGRDPADYIFNGEIAIGYDSKIKLLFNIVNVEGRIYNALSVFEDENEYVKFEEYGEEYIYKVNHMLGVYYDLNGNDLKVDTLMKYKLDEENNAWEAIEKYTYDEEYGCWKDAENGKIKEDVQANFDYYLNLIKEEKLKQKRTE